MTWRRLASGACHRHEVCPFVLNEPLSATSRSRKHHADFRHGYGHSVRAEYVVDREVGVHEGSVARDKPEPIVREARFRLIGDRC